MGDVKFYTLEEISKNNGKDGERVWIIIKDNVYDVTDYMDDHPGGGDLIAEWAGKDGTKAFDEFGHSGDAKRDLKQYKIGEVVEEERKKKTQKKAENAKKAEKAEKIVQNGEPQVVDAKEPLRIQRSCFSIISCGLCG